MDFQITQLSTGLAAEDPRNAGVHRELTTEITNASGLVLRDPTPREGAPPAKGVATEIVVSLTSAGTITALVNAFKAWLARDSQHRTIDGEVGGKRFHIDAKGVSDGTIQTALEHALSESTEK
jgi:hypothetical protein